MVSSPNINSFALAPYQGQLSLLGSGVVMTCQVDPNLGTPLVPGQAVQIMDTSGGVPQVTALTVNTNKSWGVTYYNIKDQNFPAGAPVEVAMRNSVVWMTTSGAIGRGKHVEFVYTTNTIITWAGINPSLGTSIDKATASGQLIRVMIDVPTIEVASA